MTLNPDSPVNDNAEAELDADSLSAIRSILTEDPEPAPRRARADAGQPAQQPKQEARPVAKPRRKADILPPLEDPIADSDAEAQAAQALAPKRAKRRFSLRRKTATPKQEKAPRAAKPAAPLGGGLVDKLRNYRPKPTHIALAAVALLVVMRPWLVLGLSFIFLLIVFGIFLIVGYDGFWKGIMKASRWYADRRPERAAALHARLDRFAMRWDAVLDRFPEGSVDALYLPDFGDQAAAERRHDEAMERRLAGLQENGV